uniref:Cell wall biogenesis regulatory protein n=2 Tax=Candidatus Bipolaricaulota TaxID=67810 RepID=H5SG86_9BACT|nr:cell wall biogenesis regulatory protein [uncultured Acetothermia bacterium]BAL60213.1 cell wall biogenesis regulatory protein [Candidatus Acetothermum autotrophicum]
MKIPILDLKRQYQSIKAEIDNAIARVIESGQFILGPEVEAFEREVAQYLKVKHAIGVASGTDALWLALKAANVGPGDSVIVPSFTFFATAGAVCNVGATPVFADIDPKTFDIDPHFVRDLLESNAQLRDKTKAIIPVHLYGQPAEMDEILEIAQEYNLTVIEDAAQAIGARYRDRAVGTLGHLGCFSFFPTKNLGAYGDGGLVVTNDDALAERVRMLRVHGSKPKYYHHIVGTNSRLDALQAALLRVKLAHLDEWTHARQQIAAQYDQAFSQIDGLVVPYKAPDRTHIYHQYTIRVLGGRRDALQKYLKEHGISTEIYYPLPLHLQPCFAHLGYREGQLPESERASREVLSLPMFPELTGEEQNHVIKTVKDFSSQ